MGRGVPSPTNRVIAMRLSKEEFEAFVNTYEGMTYKELALRIKELDEEIRQADDALKRKKEEREIITLKVVPDRMDEDDMSSINIKGVGRLTIGFDMHCSVPATYKEAWHEWLKDNGHGGLINNDPNINSSTQKAFIKEQFKAGTELPEFVKADPFFRATVTKLK